MDWTSFILGFCTGVGVTFAICTIWDRGIKRDIKQLQEDIAAFDAATGSGLVPGLQRSDCQRSDGLTGRAQAERVDQAVQVGVEAYRRGYRPF